MWSKILRRALGKSSREKQTGEFLAHSAVAQASALLVRWATLQRSAWKDRFAEKRRPHWTRKDRQFPENHSGLEK
ncbi:unnamed protein product [Merluccius merluccius]